MPLPPASPSTSLGLDAGDEVHALVKSVSIDERTVPRLVVSGSERAT